jgi:hypothetical protein
MGYWKRTAIVTVVAIALVLALWVVAAAVLTQQS